MDYTDGKLNADERREFHDELGTGYGGVGPRHLNLLAAPLDRKPI